MMIENSAVWRKKLYSNWVEKYLWVRVFLCFGKAFEKTLKPFVFESFETNKQMNKHPDLDTVDKRSFTLFFFIPFSKKEHAFFLKR